MVYYYCDVSGCSSKFKLKRNLKIHKKDHHTRKGLITLVGKRKKFLKYLKIKSEDKYIKLAKELKLKVK